MLVYLLEILHHNHLTTLLEKEIEMRLPFHLAVMAAARVAKRQGNLSAADLDNVQEMLNRRGTTACFCDTVEDAVLDMAVDSGAIAPGARFDKFSIDWNALLDFIVKLLPYIVQLIMLFINPSPTPTPVPNPVTSYDNYDSRANKLS